MSQYLFQAEDQETMLSWIEAIKRNNNPDKDVSAHLYVMLFSFRKLMVGVHLHLTFKTQNF